MHQAKEIQARISRRIDLCKAGSNANLVEDTEAEGLAREGKVAREEGYYKGRIWQFHDTVLHGKL